MACELKMWFMVSMILMVPLVYGEPQVPCYFIFGDSLVDNGNNNALISTAKVNYPPYGIDFPGGTATGRFSNGLNMADFIAKFLGFDHLIPPFATASGPEILKGVNYGSGASGIRDETGNNVGGRISMNFQLFNHKITISRMVALLGSRNISAEEYLKKCIYTVGMGNNDYINNYLMPQLYPTSHIYTPDQYAAALIEQYSHQIRTLYKFGARKVALFGLGLIGCTPAEIATFGTNGSPCVDFINGYVDLFNVRLKSLVDDLNSDLTDAQFIYINGTAISSGDPTSLGITVLNVPCCDVLPTSGLCVPGSIPCSNRNTHVFWDAFHPTEIVYAITASRSYNAFTPFDTYPFDINHLAQL